MKLVLLLLGISVLIIIVTFLAVKAFYPLPKTPAPSPSLQPAQKTKKPGLPPAGDSTQIPTPPPKESIEAVQQRK